jgi:hypothetical protein
VMTTTFPFMMGLRASTKRERTLMSDEFHLQWRRFRGEIALNERWYDQADSSNG